MSIMTALFWYVAIGSACYVRMHYRMRPYKEYMLRFWTKAVPDLNPNVANEASNLIVCILIWPMVITSIKTFWTNKDIRDKVKSGIEKLEKEEGL